MNINTERKSISLNKCSINQDICNWIEQDIIVPDTKPDAIKIVHVNVTPYVSDVEIQNGKVKVLGKINYFIIYRVSDEKFNTRGLFISYPYTEVLDVKDIDKDMDVSVVPYTKNVIFSLPNERKIAVKSEICFRVRAKCRTSINLINSFNDDTIECKMCDTSFNNIIKQSKNIIASKEDVMLPKEAEDFFEVLDIDANIKNTEFKDSYNKIMVKGEIQVKMVYIADGDTEQVKRVSFNIPFSSMIEMENINDRSKFDINYTLQDFNLKPNSDITSTKTMSADYKIEADVTMFEEENTSFVDDFYSQTKELVFENSRVDVVNKNITIDKNIGVVETITNILPNNTNVIDYNLDTNSINTTVKGNGVHVEGNAKVTILTQNTESQEIESKTIDVLVNEDITLENVEDNAKITVEISNNGVNLVQNGNDIELDMNILVRNYIENVTTMNLINDITDDKLDLSNLDSMNIYIVKPGDTLWNIAKKYKTSVDKLLATNEDIIDKDNINVGQKILIIR